jgi:4'-phosphopantetheinyl transferase
MSVSAFVPGRLAPAPALPLATDEVHVWLADDEAIAGDVHAECATLLCAAEAAQERRFYFAGDRRRYRVTRALVRTVLSRYVPIDPREWTFRTNAYGRPEIANEDASAGGLSFNLSHTQGLIVLGVTRHRALGVDVENLRAREISMDVAQGYFAPEEVAALMAVPAPKRRHRFYEYWTLKEAYIKARGMGLSLPLDRFHFEYPHEGAVELVIDPVLADHAQRWQLWQLRPAPGYRMAICAERVTPATRLVFHHAVPSARSFVVPEVRRVSRNVTPTTA